MSGPTSIFDLCVNLGWPSRTAQIATVGAGERQKKTDNLNSMFPIGEDELSQTPEAKIPPFLKEKKYIRFSYDAAL